MRTVLPEDSRKEHRTVAESSVQASNVARPKWYSTAYLAQVFAKRPAQLLALLGFIVIATILIYVFAAGSESTSLDLCGGTTNGTTCSGGQVTLNTAPTGGGGALSNTEAASAVFPQPNWVASNKELGRVDAIRKIGNTVYIGGNFSVATDVGASSSVTRNYLAAVDATTGKLLSWNPNPNGRIYDIRSSPDGNEIFVSGDFTAIGGTTQHNIAALNPTTGALMPQLPNLNFSSGASAWVMQIYGETMYVGGTFTGPGSSLFELNLATSPATVVSSWKPTVTGSGSTNVKDIALVTGTNRLIIGGWFTSVNGASNKYITAIDSGGTGSTLPWSGKPSQQVLDLTYYAGNNSILAGTVSDTVTSYNATTGAQNWVENTDGNVQAITLYGTNVIAGMHGDCVGAAPGQPSGRSQTGCVGPVRHKIFKLDAATGALDKNWDPAMSSGGSCGDSAPLGVWALDADSSAVYAGGDFTSINGGCHQRFAIFRAS